MRSLVAALVLFAATVGVGCSSIPSSDFLFGDAKTYFKQPAKPQSVQEAQDAPERITFVE